MSERIMELLDPSLILDPSDPMPSAEQFVESAYVHNATRVLQHHRGTFYHWTGSAYAKRDEAALRAELYHFLGRAMRLVKDNYQPFKPTISKVANVLDALKAVSNLPADTEPPSDSSYGARFVDFFFLPLRNTISLSHGTDPVPGGVV